MNSSVKYLAYFFFLVIGVMGSFALFNTKFEFSFEDFFPQNDPDLDFFMEFIEDFETDDNFYLIALENKPDIFQPDYLRQLDDLSRDLRKLEPVKEVISLSTLAYPVMTPLGMQMIPAVPVDEPNKYAESKDRLSKDVRFMKTLISEDFTSSIINLKIADNIPLETSNLLVDKIDSLVQQYSFQEAHYLGRANFQKTMIELSMQEIMKSAGFASILVFLIMVFMFRKFYPVLLTMSAIGLAMMGFMSYMYLSGQAFNAMAGLFPILMIIVSTSDVIHLLSKYIDELSQGKSKQDAIRVTIKDIGMATLLTSITTSIGFATLLFSRLNPIRQFGLNAAAGVMIAFVVILIFAAVFFPLFDLKQLTRKNNAIHFWERVLEKWYQQTIRHKRRIIWISSILILLSFYGISLISTNYKLVSNLPTGAQVTEDYLYFEEEYAGYRPLEVAVTAKGNTKVTDYRLMQDLVRLEEYIAGFDAINHVTGYSMVYKSIHRMMNGNTAEAYVFPSDSTVYAQYNVLRSAVPSMTNALLISKDEKKTRISTRVDDVGAEEVQAKVDSINTWIAANLDSDLASYKMTGTAMLLDKNMFYLRESLLKGLGFAICMVSLVMVLLFRNWRLIIISIIPNLIPLLVSAAILGLVGVELEAGIAIVFAIAFGIAVDDTIHFLSKFKLERNKGKSVEAALHRTFLETGKAIVLTSIILFFGFFIMFFSSHPPSRSIGILIAVTLIAALIADLYLIPLLFRFFFKKERTEEDHIYQED